MSDIFDPMRSAAQDDDNIEATLDGDAAIKIESAEDVHVPLGGFTHGETIAVDSDAEDDETATATVARSTVPPSEDGLFVAELTDREKMLQAQRRMVAQFKARKAIAGTTKPANTQRKPRASSEAVSVAESAVSNETLAADFARVKADYMRKFKAKKTSLEEDIEFMKIEAAEQQRVRKLQADLEYDNPISDGNNSDAVSEPEDGNPEASGFSAVADEDDEITKTPAKRGRKRANSNAGVPPRRKKARRDESEDVLVRANKAIAAKGRKKKTPAAKKSKMTNLSLRTDVFADAAAVAHLCDQPTSFGEVLPTRRDKALKELVAGMSAQDKRQMSTDEKRQAAADRRMLDNAIKKFTGQASVKPTGDGGWLVKGMESSLKHYQVLGVSFMREREGSTVEPKGGILADQMGLGKSPLNLGSRRMLTDFAGKTVMMLANIVNGKPTTKKGPKATLIVASPSLIDQWAQEIQKHTMSNRENKIHGVGWIQNRSGHRLTTSDNIKTMEDADIVLTTYHEVIKSYPKAVFPPQLVTSKQKEEFWAKLFEAEKGELHRVQWLRVVLDEAHAIKNHRSSTSMACRALRSKYNWAITGTPIQNRLEEFYPFFKFIREPTTGSYRIFKENFCTPDDPTGAARLAIYLNKVMIRRTHLDTLFNARLLDLPPPKELTIWVEFNDVERQVYEIIKKRFIERINKIAKEGALDKQYKHIFCMVMRLRQITSHLLLVQAQICDLLEREDYEKLNGITADEDTAADEGYSILKHLREVLKNSKDMKTVQGGMQGAVIAEGEVIPIDVTDADGADHKTMGGMHGVSYSFKKYLTSLKGSDRWAEIEQRSTCAGCKQAPRDPQVTSCWHIYCNECLQNLQHFAARRGCDQARCIDCGEAFTSVSPCDVESFRKDASPSESSAAPTVTRGKKNTDIRGMENWIGMEGQVLPSAKTRALKMQVLAWKEEDPDCKIIIFTQWIPMTRILAKICKTEGWSFSKYTGEMSPEARTKAIHEFGDKAQILLASLRSGGLGLNLTMATKVICLDPWWNASVEQQAFCRVFRIGQKQETTFVRLVVKNTIDAAMMAMKERKQMEIDEVMQSNPGNKKDDLSVKELLALFGPVAEGEDGRPFIFAEDGGEDEHLRVPNHDEHDEMQMMGDAA